MKQHDFTIDLIGVNEITSDLEDRLFEAGCDDATLVCLGGQCMLDFTREAKTLDLAIRSALGDVRKAGYAGALSLSDDEGVKAAFESGAYSPIGIVAAGQAAEPR